jgi:hypothetical protein
VKLFDADQRSGWLVSGHGRGLCGLRCALDETNADRSEAIPRANWTGTRARLVRALTPPALTPPVPALPPAVPPAPPPLLLLPATAVLPLTPACPVVPAPPPALATQTPADTLQVAPVKPRALQSPSVLHCWASSLSSTEQLTLATNAASATPSGCRKPDAKCRKIALRFTVDLEC